MKKIRVLLIAAFLIVPSLALAQDSMKKGDKAWTELEKTLEDANLQWLCAGKYYKSKAQACVDFRAQFWADQFFEIGNAGLQTKAEMVAGQTARAKITRDPSPGEGPNPTEFTLMAVYGGDLAMAVDHTLFKIRLNAAGQPDYENAPAYLKTDHWYPDESGKLAVTREVTFVRMFTKENGKWRPAAGVSVPRPPAK